MNNDMNIELDNDWESFSSMNIDSFLSNETFINDTNDIIENIENTNKMIDIPEPGDLYISTKTMIGYINITKMIPLFNVFWKIPILMYHEQKEGILKKQMKFTCLNQNEINKIDILLEDEKIKKKTILSSNISDTNSFKVINKVDIGLCKKDITSYRSKNKNVFYNCIAMVIRLLCNKNNKYKEIHIKLFNTGKMEIPGIQDDNILKQSINIMINTLKPLLIPYFPIEEISYNMKHIKCVLINSNFSSGFYIKRNEMFNLLRNKYNILSIYDPCSYPGIQSKFYYNTNKHIQNGCCECITKCNKKTNQCKEISFMIFRTGSVLIVGNCDKDIIHIIYSFLCNIFKTHFNQIYNGMNTQIKKNKSPRVLKNLLLYVNNK